MNRPQWLPLTVPQPKHLAALALAGLMLTSACVTDAELERDAPDLLEREGIEYELLGPIAEEELEEPVPSHVGTIERPQLPVDPVPLREYSREELADALRPVIATGEGEGAIYIASEPAWAAADAVLAGNDQPFSVEPVQRTDRPAVEPDIGEAFREIFGTDNRYYVSNTSYSPFNAIARIEMYRGNISEGSCSGVYIGPWTMITAAHCLVYSDTMRANRIIFQPARAGSNQPYGPFDCRLDDASSSNDYLWSVPSGFYTGQDPNLDYAVIDTFPCHAAPAHMPGYQANEPAGNFYAYGYPGTTCPGAPSAGTYNCGMLGSAYPNFAYMESLTIDTSDGQSGGPWFRYYTGTGYKPVGTYSGYIEYHDFFRCGFDVCKRNAARRIDNAYSQFIVDVAYDF